MKQKWFSIFGILLVAVILFLTCSGALAAELTGPSVPSIGDRSYLPVAIAVLAASAVGIAAVIIIPRLRRRK